MEASLVYRQPELYRDTLKEKQCKWFLPNCLWVLTLGPTLFCERALFWKEGERRKPGLTLPWSLEIVRSHSYQEPSTPPNENKQRHQPPSLCLAEPQRQVEAQEALERTMTSSVPDWGLLAWEEGHSVLSPSGDDIWFLWLVVTWK